ncbi:MAG: tetratricopeptide repeat protein [Candidatus Acinetobacter avistercoris]|uniref:YbgF trimerization domain-containing protein n=1 Tax=Acinetobacter sp. KS-LM10 TaxID=3120518 RepID=UPI001FA38E98|nr:tetratricopeptide repeat protein [Candidatus Acinetobacter avistercoris]
MMLNKYTLLTLAILGSTSVFANIPIESRGLSQSSGGSNQAVTVSNNVASSGSSSNLNWDLIQKNQQLENQLRELRGKIEEQDHQIDQLNKELTNRYADLDQRLELLQQKIEPTEDQPESENPAPSTTPPVSSAPNSTQQTTTAQSSPSNSNNAAAQTELDKAAYTIALDAYKQGGAKKAIAPMQNFVKNNPNSVYTGNAYFWLAEFNLAIEPPNYVEAKKYYEIVASTFPNSAKAPRSLYQLYSIAKDVNKNLQTADVYKKKLISTYPSSEEAAYFNKS